MKKANRFLLIGLMLCIVSAVLVVAAHFLPRELVPEPTTIVVEQTTQPEWYYYEVFVTNYGEKYHRAGCHYLSQSCNSIALINAINRGYTACSYCHPPLPDYSGEG